MAGRICRLGQFEISDFLMVSTDKLALRLLMARLVPYRVEHRFERKSFHYLAESDLFDEVEEGGLVPWYCIEQTEYKGGKFEWRATRLAQPSF